MLKTRPKQDRSWPSIGNSAICGNIRYLAPGSAPLNQRTGRPELHVSPKNGPRPKKWCMARQCKTISNMNGFGSLTIYWISCCDRFLVPWIISTTDFAVPDWDHSKLEVETLGSSMWFCTSFGLWSTSTYWLWNMGVTFGYPWFFINSPGGISLIQHGNPSDLSARLSGQSMFAPPDLHQAFEQRPVKADFLRLVDQPSNAAQ